MITAAAAAISMLGVKPQFQPAAARNVQLENRCSPGCITSGSEKLVLGSISLDMFAVLLAGAVWLLPAFANDILKTGPWGLGLLRCAPAIGATAMAVLLAYRPMQGRIGVKMLWCVVGFGVATIFFGISHSLVMSMIALILVGATDMVSVVVRGVLIQLATPNEMRGRVNAVDMIFIGTSNELGGFESGVTAAWLGTCAGHHHRRHRRDRRYSALGLDVSRAAQRRQASVGRERTKNRRSLRVAPSWRWLFSPEEAQPRLRRDSRGAIPLPWCRRSRAPEFQADRNCKDEPVPARRLRRASCAGPQQL